MSDSAPLQVLNLFPSNVLSFDLEERRALDLNAQLEEAVEALFVRSPDGRPSQSQQSGHDLHRQRPFKPFVTMVEAAVGETLRRLGLGDVAWDITGCWANVDPPGQARAQRSHSNNYLAGTYNLRSGPGADIVTFLDPRPQSHQIAPRFTEKTAQNAADINLPAPSGRLLVFPAWIPYAVPVNRARFERMSISFTVMFSDYAGLIRSGLAERTAARSR